jgi:ABC-type sugar transport system permease subunit
MGSNLPSFLTAFLSDVISRLYNIITASGIQILIFLSGLHTISPALYEASNIEARPCGKFLENHFPMLGPYLL